MATIPTTLVMFALSKRAGRLADRFGPRLFMGCGPLVGAVGIALMLRLDADFDYWTELFPALLLFSLGLVATVAPLTATVLADADEHNAGHRLGRQQRDRPRRRAALHRRGRRRGRPPSPRRARSTSRASTPAVAICAGAAWPSGGVLGLGRHPQPAPRGPVRRLRAGSQAVTSRR